MFENQALAIIDVQHVLSDGKYAVADSAGVIARINAVSSAARSAGAMVVVIQHQSRGGPLDLASEGWQLAAGLNVRESDLIVHKTGSDAFHKTELHDQLQAFGIKRLVVCGFQSEFCVDSTVRRALALGYDVTLVSDGHSTLDTSVLTASQIIAHHNETLSNITSFAAQVSCMPAGQAQQIWLK